MPEPDPLHLAVALDGVALDGAGWHPAARREPSARPRDLFSPAYWVDLVTEAAADRLAHRGRFRTEYRTTTLRGHLGLPRPASRYAAASAEQRIEVASA
ncbi:hypothetical protein [Frankia tisae]|uniref:hypothetical protein n=1 Tax=Frankia tisae TaxID=2950104 RepID=UPI0034D56415